MQFAVHLTARQIEVLEYVRKQGRATRSQIARRFKIAPATASIHLSALSRTGRAAASSHGRGAYWVANTIDTHMPPVSSVFALGAVR